MAYALAMTDAAPPRNAAPFALIFGILSFVIAAGVAGTYLWDRQRKDEDQNVMIIDQLRRIDERLNKIETGLSSQDISTLTEKIEQMNLRLAESANADPAVLSQQLQIIIEHQIKLQNDLIEIKEARAVASEQASAQNDLRQQQQVLLNDLQNIAPSLITPLPSDNLWSKITSSWQRWVTVRPQASATADITTPSGKISRALYELEQGQVEAALNVLPDDPRLAAFRANAETYVAQSKAAQQVATAPVKKSEETKPMLQLQPLPQPPVEEQTP